MLETFRRLLPALLLTAFLPLLCAQDGLKLESGLAAFQVLQRDGSGRAAASLSGSAPAAGPIEARIVEGRNPVLDWRKIADAAGGRWSGRLEGLPTGGEYRLELRLREASGREQSAKPVEHLAVGDLWVLAGPGFAIRKADGAELPLIYEALVDPDRPDCVILKLGGKPPEGATLWYGAGFDPYLSLVDGEDMAAPVFGPVPIRAGAAGGAAGG